MIMLEYKNVLKSSSLFRGIPQDKIITMCDCLNTKRKSFMKNEKIIWENSAVSNVNVVLSGKARSFKTEISGKTVIVTTIKEGEYIGVLLASSRNRKSPVNVEAIEEVLLLSIPVANIVCRCKNRCLYHDLLLTNYLDIVAEKSMVLHDRIDCLIRNSVREKVLAYLNHYNKEQNSNYVTVPLDRNGMAEYLNVERSALSRELSNMKKESLIDYKKNKFIIHND